MTALPLFSAWRRSDALLLALSVCASILMGLDFTIAAVRPDLDSAYVYAFSHATTHHVRWGRDFISTYGPFGCVIKTMDLGGQVWGRLAASLALAAGFGVATCIYVRGVPGVSTWGRVGAMIALIYAFSAQDTEYGWFTFLLLILLVGILADGPPSLAAYAVAGLVVGFFLLVKFSLGLSSAVTLCVGCCLVRRPAMAAWRLAVSVIALATAFLSGWLGSGSAASGIVPYLTLGLEMARGYYSAMTVYGDGWWIVVGAFLVWFVMLALWGLMMPSSRTTLLLAGLAFPVFTAWKHSVVRQDSHVAILVRFGVFVIVLLVIETVPTWGWRRALPGAGLLLAPLALVWTTLDTRHVLGPDRPGWNPVALRGLTNLGRLMDLSAYRAHIELLSTGALRPARLPRSMRQIIGEASVDVYPWNASYVRANQLTWVNRPLPASFNAYTPTLDALNAAFFGSDRRPAFLIWHSSLGGLLSIDDRHLFWDEPRTLQAIVDHYEVVESRRRVVLLRARPNPRAQAPEPFGTTQVPWDVPLPVPETDGLVFIAPALSRSLVLDLVSLVFRGQPVTLHVYYRSTAEARFRLITFNRDAGIWLSPLSSAFADLPGLLEQGHGPQVAAIAFEANALVRMLVPSITVRWFRLAPRDASRGDSAARPATR